MSEALFLPELMRVSLDLLDEPEIACGSPSTPWRCRSSVESIAPLASFSFSLLRVSYVLVADSSNVPIPPGDRVQTGLDAGAGARVVSTGSTLAGREPAGTRRELNDAKARMDSTSSCSATGSKDPAWRSPARPEDRATHA